MLAFLSNDWPTPTNTILFTLQADIVPQQKAQDVNASLPGTAFHPVDFVIPVGPIFAYVLGMYLFTFSLRHVSYRECILTVLYLTGNEYQCC